MQDAVVNQSNWNGDKLDGSGPSGVKLDYTKANIYFLDLQWLGVGRVRTGVNINNQFIVGHQFENANINQSTYMTTANLPIRYEITNTSGVSSNSTLKQICSTIIHEGLEDRLIIPNSAQSLTSGQLVTNSLDVTAMMIRPKATFGGKTNRIQVIPESFDFQVSTNNIAYKILINPVVTGTANWVSAGVNSCVEYSTTALTYSGGTLIDSGWTISGSGINAKLAVAQALTQLALGLDINGANPDTYALAINAYTGNATVQVSGQWSEVRN